MFKRLQKPERFLLTITLLALTTFAFGQTSPTFYSGNTNSPSNSFPFNVAAGKAMQSLIAPAEFSSPTGGAYFGNITAFYVQGTANITGIWSNLTIKMSQTTATALPTGTLYPGPWSTVYTATSTTATSTAAGWLKITLQTPFLYDPSKSLVVEISQCASTGGAFNVTNVSRVGFRRTYNSSTCTMAYAGQDANLFNCGVDMSSAGPNDIGVYSIDSPGMYCSAGTKTVMATLKNYGTNQITTATVGWSVNGTAQTPYSFFGLLDTVNGANPTTSQVTLGTFSFPSTPVIVKAWTSSPNGNTDTIPSNDSASVSRQASVSGNYTIDPAGSGTTNFTSFADAISFMAGGGLCGPIKFTVAPGTYTGQIVIPDIAGASPTNTITFEGVNRTTCILNGNIVGGIIVMNATKFITIKNFTVTNTNTGTAAGIAIVGSFSNVNLFNCDVNLPILSGTASNGYCINATGTLNGTGVSAMGGDSLTIDSCTTMGGGYGIVIYGQQSASVNRGMVITNTSVLKANYMGGYIAYNFNPIKIINNTFDIQGQNYGVYALYYYYNQSSSTTVSHEIINNKITNFAVYGIYLYYPVNTTTAAPTKIYNNMLQSGLGNGTYPGAYYGIYMYNYNAATNANIYHNTIIMNNTGTSTGYSCFYNTGSNLYNMKNNIFAIYGGTGCPVYLATVPSVATQVDYNVYYNGANPTTGNVIYRGGFFTPATYKTATAGGANSNHTNPSFVSRLPIPGDLHVTDGCDGVGTNLSAIVPTDIDGDLRSTTAPTPGADEFIGGSADNIRVAALLSPTAPITAGTQDLRFLVKNIGSNTVSNYYANYKNNAGTPVNLYRSVTMATCGLDTAVFTGGNQVTMVSNNQLTLYTSLPNGNTDSDRSNDTMRVSLFTPLSGTYTVGGTAPDFPTPAAAIAALAYGVAGPVTFDIRPGTYVGQLIINGAILGASATNRITFDGNDRTNRIISANVTGPAFLINNASYITIKNLKLVNTGSGNSSGIGVVCPSATYNVKGIKLIGNEIVVPIQSGTSSTGYGIIFTGTAGATGIGPSGADSSEVENNIITGGAYSLVHYGSTNASYNRGLKFIGNTINNANYMGCYIAYNYNPIQFIGNTVNVQGQNYGYYGVYYYSNQSSNAAVPHRFIGNNINGYSYYGIYMYYPANSTAADTVEFYNNTLNSYPSGYTLTQYGVYLALGVAANVNVYHNTIVTNTSAASTSATGFYSTGSTNLLVKNNIFALYSGIGVPIYLATSVTGNRVNYNNYYNALGSTGPLIYNGGFWNSSTYLTSARGGDSSYNIDPMFVSRLPIPGNLHLTSACSQRGVDLTYVVPTDIDGDTRSVPPHIGSDESATGSLDLAVDQIITPTFPVDSGWQDVVVRVRNNGATTITSFNVSYKMNSGSVVTQPVYATLLACDTMSVIFTGTQQVHVPYNVSNNLRVYTSAPNGSADLNASNDTVDVLVATAMSGGYVIGTSAPSDYPSFTAANNAMLTRGINGSVTFLVRTGTYVEAPVFKAVPGAGGANTITFRSMANHRDSVIIDPGLSSGFVIQLNGAVNTKLNKLTLRSLAISSTQHGVSLTGACMNDTIEDCYINMAIQNSYASGGIYGTGLNYTFDGFVVKNNLIRGAYYGLYIYGTSNTYVSRHRNIVIENNTIDQVYYSSFYSYYGSNFTFHKNLVTPSPLYASHLNYFMYLDTLTITNNTWNLTNTSTVYLGYYSYNSMGRRGLVANNVITGTGSMVSANIYLGYYCQYFDVYNNSISVNSSTQAAYIYNTGIVDMKVKNNVFHNTGFGSAAYFAAFPTPTMIELGYNNYFTTGTNLTTGSGASTTLTAWRNACNCDKTSLSFNPGFTSTTNLLPNATNSNSWSLNGRAEHLVTVPADINGIPRPATPADGVPDIGAYEFTPTAVPLACVATPTTPSAGTRQVFTFGSDSVMAIEWDAFATPPTSITVRQYTGTQAPLLGTATSYTKFWVDVATPSGFYVYTPKVYYKKPWIGTVSSETALRMSTKTPTNAWINLTYTNSGADSTNGSLSAAVSLTELPAMFTGTDDANPLPVNLMRFVGSKVDNDAQLQWMTASERNSSYFEVERSFNGREFTAVGRVRAMGTSVRTSNYQFRDEDAFGRNEQVVYYRLRMVDLDGSYKNSNTIVIRNAEEVISGVKVFPNPFRNEMFLEYPTVTDEQVELRDLSGRLILTQTLRAGELIHQINLNSNLDNGVYFLNFSSGKVNAVKLIRN